MKQQLLVLIAFSLLTACHAQRKASADTAKGPKLYFIGGDLHDFGTITEGPDVEYTFVFKNVGKSPLIITSCFSGSGDMVPEYGKEPVLPGKKGRIIVSYNTAGKSGPFDKTIYIQSNALTERDRQELYIRGTVVPDTAKMPRFEFIGGETHDFGNVPAGPFAEYTFVFKNAGRSPLIIQSCSSSSGSVVPEWEKEPVLPGKKGRIKVTMHTEGGNGPFYKTVYIQSNVPRSAGRERYELFIKGRVVDDTAHGPVFYFLGGDSYDVDSIPAGMPVVHTFLFKNAGKAPLIIEGCSGDGDWKNVEWIKTPVLPGDTGWVKVTALPIAHFGTYYQPVYINSNYHGANNHVYLRGTLSPSVLPTASPARSVPPRRN